MLKYILLISVFLSLSAAGSAKKMIRPIEYVASVSDLIVKGEIISVANACYQFKIAETIKGKSTAVITVQQFTEWMCDVRYAKAAKGQQLFLFLKTINGKFEIVNGSTGELPVIDNKVTLAYENPDPKTFLSRPYQIPFEEFKAGIKGFIHLFAMIEDHKERRCAYFLQNGKESELQKFIAGSSFSKWMYEKVQRNYTIRKS